jgi:hypothetical protein
MSPSAPDIDIFIGVAFYAGRNPVSIGCDGSVGWDGKTASPGTPLQRLNGGVSNHIRGSESEIGRGDRTRWLFARAPAGLPASLADGHSTRALRGTSSPTNSYLRGRSRNSLSALSYARRTDQAVYRTEVEKLAAPRRNSPKAFLPSRPCEHGLSQRSC